jgi:hypothetical protein
MKKSLPSGFKPHRLGLSLDRISHPQFLAHFCEHSLKPLAIDSGPDPNQRQLRTEA